MRLQTPQQRSAPVTLHEKLMARRKYSTPMLYAIVHGLRSAPRLTLPTEDQRRLTLMGLLLGGMSIPMALFPVCGFPVAITGLLLGIYARRTTTLHAMSSWAIVLSAAGLVLTFLGVIIMFSIYVEKYLWQ